MAYDTGTLRSGATHAQQASASAESAVTRLLGLSIGALAFGEIDGTQALAGGLHHTRDGYARMGADVSDRHAALDRQAQSTAGQGDDLVPDTASIARSARIADLM